MGFVSELSELSRHLPKDDQIALGVLHDAAEIAEWAFSRAGEYQRQIAELLGFVSILSSIRNGTLPIYRLPNEILMKVFEDPCLDCGDVRLQLVCRHWKSVMLSTPRFWANLLAMTTLDGIRAQDVRMLRQCIRRSEDVPLRIVIKSFDNFVDDLFRYRHRVSSLRVDYLEHEDNNRPLQDLVSAGMRNLCHLHVGTRIPHVTPGSLMCRQDLLPRLHRLNVPMDLLSPTTIVTSLKTIELWGEIPDLDSLVDALRKCPALEVLLMSPFHIKTLGIHGHKVDFPNLRRMIFVFGRSNIATLLTRITFPPTTSIKMYDNFGTGELDSLLSSPDSPIFRTTSEFNYVLVTIAITSFSQSACLYCGNTANRDRERLCIDVVNFNLRAQVYRQPFLRFPVTTLTLVLEDSEDQEEGPLQRESALWEAFPRVHTFELSASKAPPIWLRCQHVQQFMEIQGDERRLEQLTLVWEVPEAYLSDLAKDELQKLEAVIRARHEDGKVRIETLRLHRFRRSSYPSAPSNPHCAVTAGDGAASANSFGGFYGGFVNRMRGAGLVGNIVINDTPLIICQETT